MFYEFIEELNKYNSTNYKLEVLKAYSDNSEIVKLLKMVYDKVMYTYSIRLTNINIKNSGQKSINLDDLKPLYTREYTGNKAIDYLQGLFDSYTPESQEVLKRIIERDLKCGISSKSINKVFKNLIFELPYMRCSLMDKVQNITYPAMLQVKMDGTYRTIIKKDDEIIAFSRSGESHEYPKLFKSMIDENLPNGAYIGELMLSNLEGSAQDKRFKSNGILNSLNVPDEVTFYVWDYLSIEDFQNGKCDTQYAVRFDNIRCSSMMEKVKYEIVKSLDEALIITRKWISEGEEGGVLKDSKTPFENKTSKYQIKLKTIFDVDVKITGFTEGKNKRASTFGAIMFESSDGKLKGQCSGFTDLELDIISKHKESYINKIMTVQATDVSKAKNSDYYALTFPRFLEFREDKTEADSLERILKSLEMVKTVDDD